MSSGQSDEHIRWRDRYSGDLHHGYRIAVYFTGDEPAYLIWRPAPSKPPHRFELVGCRFDLDQALELYRQDLQEHQR